MIRTALIALVVLAGVAMLVEWLVVTDREALEAWAQAAATAAEQGDTRRLSELLSEDFRMGSSDRAGTIARAAQARETHGVRSVTMTLREIEIDGDTATALARIDAVSLGRIWPFETRLTFVRLPGGWAVSNAEPLIR